MSGTESEDEFELVSSQPNKEYDTVPESKEYQFKMKSTSGTVKLKYLLKEGKTLPYKSTLTSRKGEEFKFTFGKNLSPSCENHSGFLFEDWYIFDKDVASILDKSNSDVSNPEKSSSEVSILEKSNSEVSILEKSNSDVSILEKSHSEPQLQLQKDIATEPTRSDTREDENDLAGDLSRSASSINLSVSVHQNPNWLSSLKDNFKEEIISACSSRVKQAAEDNEYIESEKEFKRVRNEILNRIVGYLKNVFGSASRPGIKQMREVILMLAIEYPDMFLTRAGTPEKRGVDKVDIQAQKMCDRYRENMRREAPMTKSNQDEDGGAPVSKKVRLKDVYGVSREKWFKKKNPSSQTMAAINSLQEERDYNKREKVFEEHREELCHEFREGRKNISLICRPFFMDSRHLGHHFQFISETPPLDENIEKHFKKFIGYLELFILDEDRTIDTRESISNMETVCDIEYNGSTTLKDIHLLRLASEHFDGSGSTPLIKLESDRDDIGDDGSPHIFAILVEKSFVFELWVEGAKLLGNLKFVQCLAAFYHLCFSFDLKYPKGGQTVADIIQRQVCKYGDDSGTRTWKRKDSAEKKVEYFRSQICKLVL